MHPSYFFQCPYWAFLVALWRPNGPPPSLYLYLHVHGQRLTRGIRLSQLYSELTADKIAFDAMTEMHASGN